MDSLPPISIVDILALIAVALGTLQGWHRGLSGELARLAGIVAALILGLYLFHPFGDWILKHTLLGLRAANTLAFLTTAIAATVVMVVLRFLLKRLMKIVIEERADKVGGLFAGLVRCSAFVFIVFLIMNLWPHDYLNRKFGEESLIGAAIIRFVPSLREHKDESRPERGEDQERQIPRRRGARP